MENQFHMTVAVLSDSTLTLTKELQLLKAALLYADKVTLCSPKVVMLLAVFSFVSISDEDQRLDFLLSLAPNFGARRAKAVALAIRTFKTLRTKKVLSKVEKARVNGLRNDINLMWQQLQQQYEVMAEQADIYGLSTALETGLVTLQPFQTLGTPDKIAEEFYELAEGVS